MQQIGQFIYLESLILCLTILIVLFIANVRYWRPIIINRLSLVYITVAINILVNIAWVFIDGNPQLAVLNKVLTICSSSLMTLICMFYYYHVLHRVGIHFQNGKFWYISSFFAIASSVILYVVSAWTGTAFYIDDAGYHQRGVLFFGDLIASYAYVICGVVFALVKASKSDLLADRHKYQTLAAAIIPSVILGIVNSFLPYPYGLPIVFYGIVISLLILFASASAGRVTRDSLTGLLNRFAFDSLLNQVIKRKGSNDLWLIMADINCFKKINDTFGHAVGDEVLIRVSATLENVCGQYKAFVGRWGGDEFIAFIETNNDETALELLEALKKAVVSECNQDERFTVSISAGASKLREYETTKHFFEEADHKLYEDKEKFYRLKK